MTHINGIDPNNQIELLKSLLEILMALNEEIVRRWINGKYPHGIGDLHYNTCEHINDGRAMVGNPFI